MSPDRVVFAIEDYWAARGHPDVRVELAHEAGQDTRGRLTTFSSNLRNGLPPSMGGRWRRIPILGRIKR